MQTTHSPEVFAGVPLREFRECVLSGIPVAPVVEAQLEAQGINVGELRERLLDGDRWRS